MKRYDINGLQDHNKYAQFIDYMLAACDAFSLVYFRYEENEVYSPTVIRVKEQLERFKIYEKPTNAWGSTVTFDTRHEYLYTLYRCDVEAREILLSVDNLFEWDYEKYPMDLCFFKDGYSFFNSSAHESVAELGSDDEKLIEDFKKMGLECKPLPDIDGALFFDQLAIPPFTDREESAISYSEPEEKNDVFFDVFDKLPLETDSFVLYIDHTSLILKEKNSGKRNEIAHIKEPETTADRIVYDGNDIFLSLFDGEINEEIIGPNEDSSSGIWVVKTNPLSVKRLCSGVFKNICLFDSFIMSVNNECARTINKHTGEITQIG